jgi:hypothetical protein
MQNDSDYLGLHDGAKAWREQRNLHPENSDEWRDLDRLYLQAMLAYYKAKHD